MCSLGGGIVDTLQRRKKLQGRFSTLLKAIQAANLTDTLEKGKLRSSHKTTPKTKRGIAT